MFIECLEIHVCLSSLLYNVKHGKCVCTTNSSRTETHKRIPKHYGHLEKKIESASKHVYIPLNIMKSA